MIIEVSLDISFLSTGELLDSKRLYHVLAKVRGLDIKRKLASSPHLALSQLTASLNVKLDTDRDMYVILELRNESLVGEVALSVRSIAQGIQQIFALGHTMMKVVSTPSTRSSSVKPLALQSLALIFGGEYACVGEVIELGVSVSAMLGGVMLPGMLFITQYRTAFVCSKTLANPKRTQSLSTSQFDVAIPHGTIHKFYRQDDPEFLKDKAASILTIQTHTFAKLIIVFSKPDRASAKLLARTIEKRIEIIKASITQRPASAEVLYGKNSPVEDWDTFDMVKEMKRQKVPEDSWIASKINEKYDLCPSYPSILYVPTKANEETIRGSAKYRSSKRFPALTYYCKESGGCLTRCAQPMAGIMGKSSKEDQEYFDLIRQTCGEMASLVIIDARSKVAAGGNRFRGKGTEKLSTYKNSRMIFMEIENIHAMRSSIDSLFNICTMHKLAESEWLNSLSSTQWLTHVQGCISAAITTAKYVAQLGESVLVHCSDGWDRTSQICALAELIIDPFYRTTKGFQILIEKEFCAFGHKFGHRMGNAEHPDERSPIFLQFLDCTWQILQQFPNSFEFSSKYLLYIFDYAYSGWFGNFLDNNEHDRKRRQERFPALSIWAALDNEVMTDSCFRNPSFEVAAEFSKAVLNPSSSIKVLRLWSEAFLRYDRIFFATDGVEELNQDGASSKEDSEKIEYKRNEDQKTSPESPKEQKRMNSDSDSDEEVELAVWMPKKDALECKACQKAFSLWRKKRHCYSCGYVFCDQCVRNIVMSSSNSGKGKSHGICDPCHTKPHIRQQSAN